MGGPRRGVRRGRLACKGRDSRAGRPCHYRLKCASLPSMMYAVNRAAAIPVFGTRAVEKFVMPYRAWFQCINPECGETYPLNSIVYQCKRCQSLLEVQHDTKALAAHTGTEWKHL